MNEFTAMKEDMMKTVNKLTDSLKGFRDGNMSAGVIDTISVSAYGFQNKIGHLATVIKNGSLITISPFDETICASIAKSLKEQGFNAYVYSQGIIHLNIPSQTVEEKNKVRAYIKKLGEDSRIIIRNIRKKYRQNMSKTELEEFDEEIQNITDEHIFMIDDIIEEKI